MDIINSLHAVKNTLESIVVPATQENLTRLIACQQLLGQIIDALNKENDDGHADAE